MLTDRSINGKRSPDDLKNTIIDGALEPWFRGRRLASLTAADVRAYVAQRQADGYASATINRELLALKRMFTLVIQAGKLLQPPHTFRCSQKTTSVRGFSSARGSTPSATAWRRCIRGS